MFITGTFEVRMNWMREKSMRLVAYRVRVERVLSKRQRDAVSKEPSCASDT